jgi:mono/diheme cytochrome c family protein
MTRIARAIVLSSTLLWGARGLAAELDLARLPPAATNSIVFDQHIRPIFDHSCVRCHGPEKPKSRFRLDNRASLLKGGQQGEAVTPGHSAESPLIHYVAGLVEDMEMPPTGKGDPLTREQISLLRAWIDQGLPWGESAAAGGSDMLVSPTVQWITVSGHKATFREHQWRREGFTAGVEAFEIRERLDERTQGVVNGRALRDEFRVSLALERDDVGFMRVGAEEFHKFSSDAGGYQPAFMPSVFSLHQDLRLDIGRAWVDFGLTLPDWPRIVVGYEYQYREGSKSTLQWGDVSNGSITNKIYPSVKRVNEDVHILKLDVSHTVGGVLIEESFRGEFYDLGTSRQNVTAFRPSPGTNDFQRIRDGQSYFHGANILRAQKQFNDWWFGSAGYLYSRLDADAALRQDSTLGLTTVQSRNHRVVMDRTSHVVNLNSLLGPWHGLSLATGVQTDWTRQRSIGGADEEYFVPGGSQLVVRDFRTDLDRASVEESLRLRYTSLPFSVVYAEGRLQQESIGHYERSIDTMGSGFQDFLRDTDASSDVRDWRVGFSTSPWTRATVTAHLRQHQKFASYKHLQDSTEGYSAFIRSRDVCTDEAEARLTLRATGWLKTTLGYKYAKTDFWTETGPEPTVANTPGGWILAGDQQAHIYSLGAVLTPMRRLYWSTTLAYHDTSTVADDNGSAVVVPYRGHIYNVLSSATFALTERIDLHGTYTFSYADYGQDNFAAGLPLGLEFQRHGVEVGVTRRWLKSISTRLQYGFYKYDEPSSGGFTDYTAHAIFGTLTLRWP